MKGLILKMIVLLIFLDACIKEAPKISNSKTVLEFVQAIQVDSVFPLVEQIYQIHIKDTPISNKGFPIDELFPSNKLTRNAAVGFVSGELREMGYNVEIITNSAQEPVTYNVIAQQNGIQNPKSVVLIGCHLDAFYGGADDNTTAVAAMLEIARAVKAHVFNKTIRFVAFDLEEFGCIGSTRYVKDGYADDVSSVLIMDLIGYSSNQPGSQKDVLGIDFPDVGDFLCIAGNNNSSNISQQIIAFSHKFKIGKPLGIIAPKDGVFFLSSPYMRSDHGLFWYRGLPALLFTDMANFRNENYHKSTDTPETINQDFLKDNTKLVAASLAILAEIQP